MASSGNEDPTCPECGEPVGVTATYCMHCGAEFETPEGTTGLDDSADVSDADDVSWGTGAGTDDGTERIPDVGDESPDVSEASGAAPDVGSESPDVGSESPDVGAGTADVREASDTGTGVADRAESGGGTGTGTGSGTETGASTMDTVIDGLRRGLGPDGFIDDSLTVLVGLVAGVVVGFGTLFVVGIATESAASVLVGLAAWLLGTILIARQRTVLGAVRLSCYAVAGLLVIGPFTAFSPIVGVDGGIWSRIVLFLIVELVVAIPAVILAVVGFAAGKARPDSVVDGTAA